ncbi:MAG: UDP-4-amino-4,6-dideoxy-N-acetyl-beta-L-altrosamine N-acetyltransferase [Terriglobales bacterium]
MTSLRDVRPDDRDMIREWRNLPQVADYMYTDHAITPEEHAAWFSHMLQDPSCKYWIIVCDGEDAGLANLYAIDRLHQRCHWAFYIVSSVARNKGAALSVECAVLNYVFDELKLEKLCCEVLAFNHGVIEIHRRFGFTQEGQFRKHIFKRGEFHDVICLAILKEEWANRRPQPNRKESPPKRQDRSGSE